MEHRLAYAIRSDPDDAAERPVFVLGCSWRCGSTLLQRYVNSTGEVFVWGENAGLMSKLLEAFGRIRSWDRFLGDQKADLARLGNNAWIANLNPEDDRLPEALRAFLLSYYAGEPTQPGVRWGFKEVQHDAAVAQALLRAFPHGRVVFLTRRLEGVLASIGAADWRDEVGGLKGAARQWVGALESFLRLDDDRVLTLRYEDLVGSPLMATRKLGDHLNIPVWRFDREVLATKVRGYVGQPKLRLAARMELARPEVKRLMEQYDYA